MTIFFGDHIHEDFYPVCLSRPVYTLMAGTSRLYRKWVDSLDIDDYLFICRSYLAEILTLETNRAVNQTSDKSVLLINAGFLPSKELISAVLKIKTGEGISSEGELVACRLANFDKGKIEEISETGKITNLKTREISARRFKHLWEIINFNGEIIASEFAAFKAISQKSRAISTKAELINSNNIAILENVEIAASVVIDASAGPVIIDKDVVIEPLTYIQGPAYIGPGSRIVGGRIREGCSIGPVCRVGGELEESIMIGYCNKYHEGFLGHAYLGEWINLGALTTNSDLKNNYSNIKVELKKGQVDSGSIKVGCFIADHTKTGIGTMLNTGITIGFSCNLYGGTLFEDKKIDSFSWGKPGELVQYRPDKAAQTAAASMARRDVEFTAAHARLFEAIAGMER